MDHVYLFIFKKKKKSVVLDKMCVFCLYPIPDSQQCVKRGSCRRLILSGLPCLFLFLFNVILRILNILYSNCVIIICFSNLIIVRAYLSYFIVLCFLFYLLHYLFGGLKAHLDLFLLGHFYFFVNSILQTKRAWTDQPKKQVQITVHRPASHPRTA